MIADDSDHSCDRLNYDQRQLVDDYVAYLRHTNIYYEEFVDNNDLINSYKTLKNINVNEKVFNHFNASNVRFLLAIRVINLLSIVFRIDNYILNSIYMKMKHL